MAMLGLFKDAGLLEALLGGMHDGLVVLDAESTHRFENLALRRMTGFGTEELAGTKAPFPYWPPEESLTIQAAFDRAMSGEGSTYDLLFMRKNGSRFWANVAPAQLRDSQGSVVGYFATIKDISEHKQLERTLQQSEQRWRSIAENPFDFVVVVDRNYRYTYVNHTAPGISPEALIGRATPFDFVDPAYHDVMREAFQTTFETGRATSYEVYVPQLGTWYSSVVGPIMEDGVVSSISILTREITQQKRAEENLRRSEHQLREAHKLHSIGTLAGGIAHDLNNILTPILSYADLVQLSLEPHAPAIGFVEGIRAAGLRARDLVQRILLFSRRREANKVVVDLAQTTSEAIKLIKASTPASITIEVSLPPQAVLVHADPGQLEQVVTNLATNALQAMNAFGGNLGIEVRQGELAQLTVKDTGPGMDKDTLRRAFEPFFTTKAVGLGTGLGLSIVHGIVTDHGGTVMLDSEPGQGVTVSVGLPLAAGEQLPKEHTPPPLTRLQTTGVRILCVDDEPAVLAVVKEALALQGHHVTALANAQAALELFQKDPSAFDLLITDQTMPNLFGTALVDACRARSASLPCVLITGLGDLDLQERATAAGVSEVLWKPFLPQELQECVERALKRRPG